MMLRLQPLRFGLPIAPTEPMANSQCEERNCSSPTGYKLAGLCRFSHQAWLPGSLRNRRGHPNRYHGFRMTL